jgi:uncharacterized membrane protein YkvA (DUF1232 family)
VLWWEALLALLGSLGLAWAVLVAVLYVKGRAEGDPARLRDLFRLLPDVVRLVRRLAADPTLPRGLRIRLALLAGYLLLPIDLVPDFIPVVGYADDALVVALVLRSVIRVAGEPALDRHWPGTPEGLRTLKTLTAIPT